MKKGLLFIQFNILFVVIFFVEDTIDLKFQTELDESGKINVESSSEQPELLSKNGILVVRPQITGDIKDVVQRDRKERIDNIMGDFVTNHLNFLISPTDQKRPQII